MDVMVAKMSLLAHQLQNGPPIFSNTHVTNVSIKKNMAPQSLSNTVTYHKSW